MNRTQHPSNNDVLGAPQGVSIEDCTALSITRVRYADGTEGVMSFWQPTDAEIELILQGKPIWFLSLGRTHAPIMLGVDGDGVMVFK